MRIVNAGRPMVLPCEPFLRRICDQAGRDHPVALERREGVLHQNGRPLLEGGSWHAGRWTVARTGVSRLSPRVLNSSSACTAPLMLCGLRSLHVF